MGLRYDVPEEKRIRVIVDTDAACEADDPFAIAHALMTKKFEVKAITAEHFVTEGSVEKSLAAGLYPLLGFLAESLSFLQIVSYT